MSGQSYVADSDDEEDQVDNEQVEPQNRQQIPSVTCLAAKIGVDPHAIASHASGTKGLEDDDTAQPREDLSQHQPISSGSDLADQNLPARLWPVQGDQTEWQLPGSVLEDFCNHHPVSMFPSYEPVSTIANTTTSQQEAMCETRAADVINEPNQTPEQRSFQSSETSGLNWSDFVKSQATRSQSAAPRTQTSKAPWTPDKQGNYESNTGLTARPGPQLISRPEIDPLGTKEVSSLNLERPDEESDHFMIVGDKQNALPCTKPSPGSTQQGGEKLLEKKRLPVRDGTAPLDQLDVATVSGAPHIASDERPVKRRRTTDDGKRLESSLSTAARSVSDPTAMRTMQYVEPRASLDPTPYGGPIPSIKEIPELMCMGGELSTERARSVTPGVVETARNGPSAKTTLEGHKPLDAIILTGTIEQQIPTKRKRGRPRRVEQDTTDIVDNARLQVCAVNTEQTEKEPCPHANTVCGSHTGARGVQAVTIEEHVEPAHLDAAQGLLFDGGRNNVKMRASVVIEHAPAILTPLEKHSINIKTPQTSTSHVTLSTKPETALDNVEAPRSAPSEIIKEVVMGPQSAHKLPMLPKTQSSSCKAKASFRIGLSRHARIPSLLSMVKK